MAATASVASTEMIPPDIMLILGPNSRATQPASGDPGGAPPRMTSM
jgi:hypothetical protein